jgi:hypothetical protein
VRERENLGPNNYGRMLERMASAERLLRSTLENGCQTSKFDVCAG